MYKKKILNDPVYGFIGIPYNLVFELMEHSYFQRLRRIKQLSLTFFVYPGALHTRFNHAVGAVHLMQQAIRTLRSKGIEISEQEAEAACVAILLHDLGHGPFSHTLEETFMPIHHETISLLFMEQLNEEFDGRLSLAIDIFKGTYKRKFLHQLISSQLDMDRMDYLNRDSFFTGVSEGVIGYDRIIKMLDVRDDQIVVEEKGIYSIEKFLVARRIMYWQVYLHKTVLAAEVMLIKIFERARVLITQGESFAISDSLSYFLLRKINEEDFRRNRKKNLDVYARLDDTDIISALKIFEASEDKVLSYLSSCILDRKLFRLRFLDAPLKDEEHDAWSQSCQKALNVSEDEAKFLVCQGHESNSTYSKIDEIQILFKDQRVVPMSACFHFEFPSGNIKKHYVMYPKFLE